MPLTTANIQAVNMMDGATARWEFNAYGTPTYIRIDKVFLVGGLTANSTAANAMVDAKLLIQTVCPTGSQYSSDEPNAVCRGYTVRPMPQESDDHVEVIVSYTFSDLGFAATQWTIDSDTYVEIIDTDAEYNQSTGNLQPIQVDYTLEYLANMSSAPPGVLSPGGVPNGSGGFTPAVSVPPHKFTSFAHVGVLKPRRRVVLTRTLYGLPSLPISNLQTSGPPSDATKLDQAKPDYEGRFSDAKWYGGDPGTWFVYSISINVQPFANTCLAQITLIQREEGWDPWVRYFNARLGGTPANIFRKSLANGPANGIRQATVYKTCSIANLLALIP